MSAADARASIPIKWLTSVLLFDCYEPHLVPRSSLSEIVLFKIRKLVRDLTIF
jgi:hypothetical protein